MKGATLLATLQKLGVVPSFSRPSVSNDNPYSEALFRTLKYVPSYSELARSRRWSRRGIGPWASSIGTTRSTSTVR
jgi:putative transposase